MRSVSIGFWRKRVGHYPHPHYFAEAQQPQDHQAKEALAIRLKEQIAAENGLISARLGWVLQINGFLFSAYGLALVSLGNALTCNSTQAGACTSRSLEQKSYLVSLETFETIVSVTGAGSGVLSLIGVWAAYRALNKCKSVYIAVFGLKPSLRIPPFSDPLTSAMGRTPPVVLSLALIVLWCWLLIKGSLHSLGR